MTYAEYTSYLSRRVGPAFADKARAALDNLGPAPLHEGWGNYLDQQILRYYRANADKALPDGWGTSPRRAPTAASYKPAHGGYPPGGGGGEGMSPAFEWVPFLICVALVVTCAAPLFFFKD